MYTYFLNYNDYFANPETGFGQLGHLLALNPSSVDAMFMVTVYFEDREPIQFSLAAPAGASTESNWQSWGCIPLGTRFAFRIDCEIPLALQVTIGQNNTGNDYSPDALGYPDKVRETVLSYTPGVLATEFYLPDGIVINSPLTIWVLEHEWLILVNPTESDVEVKVDVMYSREASSAFHQVVPSGRIKYVYMDEKVHSMRHYGARVTCSSPISVQWLRTVNWYDRAEMMSSWSLPLIQGPL